MFGVKIAIPSYKRAETLQRKTLRMLREEGFPVEDVTVFVATEEERADYAAHMDDSYRPEIVVGVLGIHRQRAFIEGYYAAGTELLCVDDDVARVKRIYQEPLPVLVRRCFDVAAEEGCRLWGVYPTDHGLCLKDRAVKGLTYIIGAFFGMVVPSVPRAYPDPFSEDYTRSILAYQEDGAVLRFEGMGPTTRYFKECGGLQEFRTAAGQEAQMIALVLRFPELVLIRKRPGKMVDARLVRVVTKMIEGPLGGAGT